MSIPEAKEKLTIKEQKKARRNAFFKLSVDLSKSVKSYTGKMDAQMMEDTLQAYVQMMGLEPKDGEDTVEVDIAVVRQMAMFAGLSLSRQLTERYK